MDDSPANEEWRWHFRILRAEILVRDGKNKEALALLDQELPPQLAASDISAWRRIVQGSASYSLNRFEDSEKFLQQAETLASANRPELLGEVRLRKGTLGFYRGDLPSADREYRSALPLARNQHNQFLESAVLGNLGMTATGMEHFDEAIEWDREALKLSQSVGAQGSVALILGNMGWCYFEMGDYEKALPLLKQAEELSARAGAVTAQLDWEIMIGNVYYESHDYDSARQAYERALDVAKKIDYETAVTECFVNLAHVGLETGQFDFAQRYRDEAAEFVRSHPNHSLDLYFEVVAGRVDEMKGKYAQAEKSFLGVIDDPATKTSLRWEAQSRLAEVYALEGKRTEADRQFRRALDTVAGARSTIQDEESRLPFLSNAIRFYSSYIEFLVSQEKAETALQVAEMSRAQTLAEGLGLSSKISFPIANFQPRQIAQRLNETLLFYWLGRETFLLVGRHEKRDIDFYSAACDRDRPSR